MISKHSEYLGTAREIAHGIVREQAEQVYSERRWPEGAIRELQRAVPRYSECLEIINRRSRMSARCRLA